MGERLNIESLRYVSTVMRVRSFTAAADIHGITQPGLSNAIARIEGFLGVRLFDSSTRGVAPTPEATLLIPLIDSAVISVDAVISGAREIVESADRKIKIGVSPLISRPLISGAFDAARHLDSPVELILRESNMGDLRAALLAGELDIVLIPSVDAMPGFEHRVIDSDHIVVVDVHSPAEDSGSPTAEQGTVELADASWPSLLLAPDVCGLTRFTEQLFAEHRLGLNPYPGEAGSYRVLEQWASLGLGAALLPESVLSGDPKVRVQPLMDDGAPVEMFYEAVWSPTSRHASECRDLADRLAAYA